MRHRPLLVGALVAAGIALVASAAMAIGSLGGSSAGPAPQTSLPPMASSPVSPDDSASQPVPPPVAPKLAGTVVNVSLTDSGGPMGEGNGPMHAGAMGLNSDKATVPHGTISFLVTNAGAVKHEMVILPLTADQAVGVRPFGGDARVDEAGSFGEASNSGAEGAGEGVEAGASGWVTVTLKPGRYELVCNLTGHYVSGMYGELTVT